MSITRADAERLDREDPLAGLRDRFAVPEGIIYLDGNSLGPPPIAVAEALSGFAADWRADMIQGWATGGWGALVSRIGGRIAPLIGAAPDEVIVTDTTSTNLFKLMVAACRMRPGRSTVLIEAANFPSDLYIAQGVCELLGLTLGYLDEGAVIGEDTALVVHSHVDFRSGHIADMTGLTRRAHEAGALMLWDLCHSAGAIPVDLSAAGADFAVGCSYKYLNGGPGAPAYAFVARGLQEQVRSPITGWGGQANRFAMSRDFDPAPGMTRLQVSQAPVIGMVSLEAALTAFDGIDLVELRRKAVALGVLFAKLTAERLPELTLVSPADPRARGNQLGYAHPKAERILADVAGLGVIGDFRPPEMMRFGFAPLYIRHVDVYDAVERLATVMAD
ncbi:kynureninase [Rhizohabitans arisaemae]|uniref:kynureninase n=1 Tax=Rhizohabitans arisaemae TaxID=2720610 RepID=UPI0024B051CB|nr:kynureninase [Rhizohabitans arisaemae]